MSLENIAAIDKTIMLADGKEYTLGQFTPRLYCEFKEWVSRRMAASMKEKAKALLAAAIESGVDQDKALAMARDMVLGREDLADLQKQASALVKAMMEQPSVEKMRVDERNKIRSTVLDAAKNIIQGGSETMALAREAGVLLGQVEGVRWVLWQALQKNHSGQEITLDEAGDLLPFGEENYLEVMFAAGIGEDPKKKEQMTPEKVETEAAE